MTIEDITTFINGVGFPIVACIYLAYANDKIRAALHENTKVLESLKQMIVDLQRERKGE